MTKAPTQILLATDTDFKPLASIVRKAQEEDSYYKLLFDRSMPNSAQDELDHTELIVWSSIKSDNCCVWKAAIEEKGALRKRRTPIGLIIITFVAETQQLSSSTPPEEARGYRHCPQTLNSRLLDFTQGELERLRNRHLGEQKYVLWRYLYVLPQYEGKSIESEMIQWGFEHFGLTNNTVVVETTRPEIFLSHGWTLVNILNVDLGLWAGGKEGGDDGYHVSVLVRNPGELRSESLVAKVDEKSSSILVNKR